MVIHSNIIACYSSARISTISSLAPRKATLQQRRCTQRVRAFEREWPAPEFIKEVEEAFPDQGIANVEEARVCLLRLHHYSSDAMLQTDHASLIVMLSCHTLQHKMWCSYLQHCLCAGARL